ncbi:MAG TPA: M48 family metallopeptidase [Chthonomonadales bacterium]|nr:M48 family metallopeptidase [Chthonomonadales bacterium]
MANDRRARHTRRSALRLGARAAVVATAGAVSLLAGCRGTNFLSTRDEVRLGRDVSRQVEAEARVDTDSADARRVQRIAQRVLAHAEMRPGIPYSVKLLDRKEINAISLPGGPIYVFRGLLDMVGDDDDALAGVIAHEVAHVNARHVAEMISQQLAANIGIIVLLRGRTAHDIATLAQDLLSLSFSREDEYEADRRGLSYAHRAGFDPAGLLRLFQKLDAMERGAGQPAFLRTHPLSRSRIERAQRIIELQQFPYGR